jgi:hypothetical protein
MLAVQVVEVLWTKATRGAPESNMRSALQRAYAIELLDAPYVLHHVRLSEWEDFQPRMIRREGRPSIPRTEGGLSMKLGESGRIHLGLIGNPSGGQPHRHPVVEALTLSPGESARLIINGRHSSYSGQWYSEFIYNVASGSSVPADRFVRAMPDHQFSLAANLF